MSGKVLKIERIKADIPQKEMAEAIGVTPSIVSMWERERVKIPEDMERLYLKKLKELKSEKNKF